MARSRDSSDVETVAAPAAAFWSEAAARANAHTQGLLRHMQEAMNGWLQHWAGDAATVTDEAGQAVRPLDIATLHSAYVAEESARAMEFGSQVLAGCLEAQSQWMRSCEGNLAVWLSAVVDPAQHPSAALSWRVLDAPLCGSSSQGLWQGWQELWRQAGSVWLDTVAHDLQPQADGGTEGGTEALPAPRASKSSRGKH